MKPLRKLVPRHARAVPAQELEAGDRPIDYQGRELAGWAPGDYLVRLPFQVYVLSRELTESMFIVDTAIQEEVTDGEQPGEHRR